MRIWRLKFASYKTPNDILNTIISGAKKVETRPHTPHEEKNYADIKKGDRLIFISLDTDEEVEKIAKGCKVYKSISEMLENENYEDIFPGIGSKENLEKVYQEVKEKWGKEYKYNLETYGIVAIYI
jgi:ASC-1-like (ASCH) protein